MQLSWKSFELEFHHPFTISRHTYFSQPGIITILESGEVEGLGEATVNPYYNTSELSLINNAQKLGDHLNQLPFNSPDELWNELRPLAGQNLFILAAINNASWDIAGKNTMKSVREFIGINSNDIPPTCITIGIDSIDTMVLKMKENPWPVYKIKLGTPDDISIVRELRKQSDAVFRVDANAAWTAERTIEYAPELSKLGVEFIEQPLPASETDGMKEVFRQSVLPVIADESCVLEEDVEKCHGQFHGINIKLMKCGGISPGLRMIRRARELNMKVMIGCMAESSIGISAAAQLLPLVDYADLDGPMLIKNDSAEGLRFHNGYIELSGQPGLGISLKQQV
ncbi:dipeptide epimerase [Bacteroidota bacterium]